MRKEVLAIAESSELSWKTTVDVVTVTRGLEAYGSSARIWVETRRRVPDVFMFTLKKDSGTNYRTVFAFLDEEVNPDFTELAMDWRQIRGSDTKGVYSDPR